MAEAGKTHQQEQPERDEDQRHREGFEPAVADPHRHQQRRETDARAQRLPLEEPESVAEPRARIDRGCAVDHDHAEHQQQEHRAEQHRVVAQGGAQLRSLPRDARSGDGGRAHRSPRTSALN